MGREREGNSERKEGRGETDPLMQIPGYALIPPKGSRFPPTN